MRGVISDSRHCVSVPRATRDCFSAWLESEHVAGQCRPGCPIYTV